MKPTFAVRAAALLLASALFGTTGAADTPQAEPTAIRSDSAATHHRTIRVDGVDIFYREAGDRRTGRAARYCTGVA